MSGLGPMSDPGPAFRSKDDKLGPSDIKLSLNFVINYDLKLVHCESGLLSFND